MEKEEPAKVIYISGGQRSGKSAFAERLVMERAREALYVATAQRSDDPEMQLRIRRHQERRGQRWTTFEEPLYLSRAPLAGRTVLIDCVTLWAANALYECADDPARALDLLRGEFEAMRRSAGATLVFVSNEIGMGGISADALQRRFTDLQGDINQLIAAAAGEAWLVVSGLPLRLK